MTSGLCEYEDCKRVIYDGKLCICHSPNKDKDPNAFEHEIELIFSDQGAATYNCSGFIFVTDDPLLHRRINKELNCKNAEFHCKCGYSHKSWAGNIDFTGAKFYGRVSFDQCVFEKTVNFSRVTFHNNDTVISFVKTSFNGTCHFNYCNFKSEVDFEKATFSTDSWFTKSHFEDEASFIKATFYGPCFWEDHLTWEKLVRFNFATFRTGIQWNKVKFLSGAQFDNAEFKQSCMFDDCTFGKEENQLSEKVSFFNTQFSHDLLITESKFLCSTKFISAKIDGIADFYNSEFRGPVDFRVCSFGKASFDAARLSDHTMFHKTVDFGNLVERENTQVQFRHIDMHTARLIEAPIHLFQFVSCRWGRREDVHDTEQYVQRTVEAFKINRNDPNFAEDFTRLGLHDDQDMSFVYAEAAQVYRKLQDKYLEYLDPMRSGIFYHKEQHLLRKAYLCSIRENYINKNPRKFLWGIGSLSLHWAYRVISGYGESTVLPLYYLGFLFLGIPWIFLMNGYNIDGQMIDYEYTGSLKDLGAGVGDFLRVIMHNLSEILARKAGETQSTLVKSFVVFQTILIPVFLTFWILAIRRRYKRKSY